MNFNTDVNRLNLFVFDARKVFRLYKYTIISLLCYSFSSLRRHRRHRRSPPPWYCLWQLTAYLRRRACILYIDVHARQVTDKNLEGNLTAGSAAETQRKNKKNNIIRPSLHWQHYHATLYNIIIIIRLVGRITLRRGSHSVTYIHVYRVRVCIAREQSKIIRRHLLFFFFLFRGHALTLMESPFSSLTRDNVFVVTMVATRVK